MLGEGQGAALQKGAVQGLDSCRLLLSSCRGLCSLIPAPSQLLWDSGLGSVPAQHHFSKLREQNSPGEAC